MFHIFVDKILYMCKYDSLYFGDDGYVVNCKKCGNYQVAFISTLLTLSQNDFDTLRKLISYKCNKEYFTLTETAKCVVVPTPCQGICMILTKSEVIRFNEILEEADNEMKVLSLLSLFNP